MKIALFAPYYPPHIGGIERFVKNLGEHLARHGHSILIVTSKLEKEPPSVNVPGMEIVRLPVFRSLSKRYPLFNFNREYHQILDRILEFDADFYILNSRLYPTSIVGLRLAVKKGKKSLLIEHGSGHVKLPNPIVNFSFHLYEHLATKYLKRKTNYFYGVSKACINWLNHFGITGNGVVHNGISENISIDKNFDIFSEYKIPENSFIVTYAGRLIIEKGVDYLADAVELLLDKYRDMYLCIAGEGELFSKLTTKYSGNNHFIFMGQVPYEKVLRLLEQSDIIVIPSICPEGLPTLLLEAGVTNCPVIATNQEGILEVITDDSLGVIIEPASVQSIYNAMEYLYLNPDYRRKLGENLGKKVRYEFNWDDITNKFSEELKNILKL